MENKGASLTKWPFVVANVMLVGLDLWMLKQLLPPHDNWDRVLAGLCLLVGAWAAWLHCRAWLVEYETRTRLQENEELKGAVEQISQLAEVGKLVTEATSRWQAAHEASAASVQAAREVSERMGREVVEFQQFLQQSQQTQIDHLNLEIDKLRRSERDWLQSIALILDHTHALHQAALRSNQPQVGAQLSTFQAACHDALRRVGVGVYLPDIGLSFDERSLALLDGSPQPEAGFVIQGVAAPGISFQGQLLRKALVVLGPSQAMEPVPEATTASSFNISVAEPIPEQSEAVVPKETEPAPTAPPMDRKEEGINDEAALAEEVTPGVDLVAGEDLPPWATSAPEAEAASTLPSQATEADQASSAEDSPSPARKRGRTTPQADLPF